MCVSNCTCHVGTSLVRFKTHKHVRELVGSFLTEQGGDCRPGLSAKWYLFDGLVGNVLFRVRQFAATLRVLVTLRLLAVLRWL